MKYRKHSKFWKYDLLEPEIWYTTIMGCSAKIRGGGKSWAELTPDGRLWANTGYAHDGATGVPDNKFNKKPACKHDVLSQMMRLDLLDREVWRIPIADEYRADLIKNGEKKWWAWACWKVLVMTKFYTMPAKPSWIAEEVVCV